MEGLSKFITDSQLILVVASYIIGVFAKKSTLIKDHFIPLIVMGFAVICNLFLSGFNVISVLQGVIIAFIAVGINSSYKQIEKSKLDK